MNRGAVEAGGARGTAVVLLACAAVAAGGCRGSSPIFDEGPENRFAAVVMGTRIILPTGETNAGGIAINLEGEGGRRANLYRLEVPAGRALLYPVEPGVYRLTPTRSVFGWHQAQMRIVADDFAYKAPFPSQIMRKGAIDLRPKKVVSLGIIEARFVSDPVKKEAKIVVRIDDSVAARRDAVQQIVRDMASASTPADERDRDFAWSGSLEDHLVTLQAEIERRPLYKPSP
ncbi:MAG: hypothetical protein HY748_17660 [Elusimicrobia bacterium]|nr:hypothetical protein [Elusimicrobiota bacterium]